MKLKKRFLSIILSWTLVITTVLGSIPAQAMTVMAGTAVKLGADLDTSNLKFDVASPDGYVTVSFEDHGVRPENAGIANEELYGTAVGTIIDKVKVPFKKGDSIADVTVRLLDTIGVGYSCTGTVEEDFYLAALKDFELNDQYYSSFGEFNAGAESGWCVRWNDWHINVGSSGIDVEDGDTVTWLYTCQFGADVGADFSSKSAQIKNIVFAEAYGILSPAFDAAVDAYTYEVADEISSIAFKVELENYASKVTVKVDGMETVYKPNQAISVTPNSKIEISTALDYMDIENNNQVKTYTDSLSIQLKTKNQAPTVVEGAPTSMEVKVKEEISVDLSKLFTDADGDALTYSVGINGGEPETVEGSVYKNTIEAQGSYKIVVTASDGKDSTDHTIIVKAAKPDNHAPIIKSEYAEEKGKTYVYSSSYVYIYMDDIFEDPDGDALTYKAAVNGEEVDIVYNSWSKQYYIQFAEKPVMKEFKIIANDGAADSEVFTATCIGTTAAITGAENAPVIQGSGSYLYYVCGSAENDTFKLEYELDVDADIVPEWYSGNTGLLTIEADGTSTVDASKVTSRQQVMIGATYGKDTWGSILYLGTKYIYILPAQPEIADMTAELAEHADNVKPTVVSSALTGGWYSSEFDYVMDNPSICDITTSGSYGLSITPKALGTTAVTAVFKYDESIKCTFDVTVTGRSLQIKDQPGEDSVIFEENKTVQMEVAGAVDGETFTWTSSSESVAAVDANGLVTVKALGTTYLTAISSLSTDDKPVKASMYLQVKEDGKVYLEDLALTQYGYFGFISAKAGFHSATLEYDWDLAENRYTYSTLQFTPYFDDAKLNAVLHYRVSGGEEQTMDLTDAAAVSIANGLNPGENVITIDVYPEADEKNVTTYTFHIFRPYNPSNTISRMTIYPNGDAALAYPTYLDNKEGTIFQYNVESGEFVTGWNGKPSTSWSTSYYNYKTFVYGDRTSTISVYPTFGYAGQRVMIYVDGEEFEEAVTNWKSKTIPVKTDGVTEIKFHVNSEKYHAEQIAAGVEDPYAVPEKIYTIYVENVTPLGIDAKILSAELSEGEFYQPGFTSDSYTISALIPADENSTELTFTVPAGIDVYKTSATDANKLTAVEQDEDGNNVYKTETVTITGTGTRAYSTTNLILQVTDETTGETGKTQYAFTVSKRGAKDVYPDSIIEYLCIGSQYTNASSYGTMPERTLKDSGGVLSLGNFGGYITYKYDTPIENSPNNPYGVDFVIYGNSFGNGAHEPGYVQVSKDGKTWYTLAGSEHFDDHNDWDYSMTYTNADGKSAWTNSDGESGQIYNYPVASAYPYYTWTEENQKTIAVTGPRLNSSAKDAYGSAAAVLPVFGYVDVNTNGSITGISNNPYNHPGTLVAGGDMFDLAWAVDAEGMPVEIDHISYIRVATASSIYAGAIGEKSTEVTTVNRVTNAAESAVGETAAPVSVTVDGRIITVPESGKTVKAKYDGEFSVEVNAAANAEESEAEGANIYINNLGSSTRDYVTAPEEGIIRIIVQEGEKEPYICYLLLEEVSFQAEDIYETTGKYLAEKTADPIVSSIGGEWAVLGLARADYAVSEDYYETYVSNLVDVLVENDGVLHDAKYTEYERVVLALTSIGYDVTDVAGYNLLDYLADYDKVVWQGLNSAIYALIALDSHDYEIPTAAEGKTQTTREKLIDFILEKQLEDGGWALSSGKAADTDMTAMALQALAPYYETDAEVKAAVDTALETLSGIQGENGLYRNVYGEMNAESNAQVVTALTALGINPDTDTRFMKGGVSVLDALCSFYVEGGGFAHILGDESVNGMATEQSYYALVSYMRLINGQTSLYDMSDVTIASVAEKPEDENPDDENPDDETTEDGAADPIDVNVTISDAGEVVVMQQSVEVIDRNEDGQFDMDEVLYAAHEVYYDGGAEAGYASILTEYGLSIAKLWGDISGSFGYWLNDASCWSLADIVKAGDYVTAFVYKDAAGWSDVYSLFESKHYTATADTAVNIAVEKAGYDENWNTVFAGSTGATITAYKDGKAVDANKYTVVDKGDGKYEVTFADAGTYYLVATNVEANIVPAVCKVVCEAQEAAPTPTPNEGQKPTSTPGAEDGTTGGTVNTGDHAPIISLFAVMMFAGLAICAVLKKKRENA